MRSTRPSGRGTGPSRSPRDLGQVGTSPCSRSAAPQSPTSPPPPTRTPGAADRPASAAAPRIARPCTNRNQRPPCLPTRRTVITSIIGSADDRPGGAPGARSAAASGAFLQFVDLLRGVRLGHVVRRRLFACLLRQGL